MITAVLALNRGFGLVESLEGVEGHTWTVGHGGERVEAGLHSWLDRHVPGLAVTAHYLLLVYFSEAWLRAQRRVLAGPCLFFIDIEVRRRQVLFLSRRKVQLSLSRHWVLEPALFNSAFVLAEVLFAFHFCRPVVMQQVLILEKRYVSRVDRDVLEALSLPHHSRGFVVVVSLGLKEVRPVDGGLGLVLGVGGVVLSADVVF